MYFSNSLTSRMGRVVTLAIAAFVVAACGSSSSSSSSPEAQIRVVHAVADAPRVNVYLGEDLVLEERLTCLAWSLR